MWPIAKVQNIGCLRSTYSHKDFIFFLNKNFPKKVAQKGEELLIFSFSSVLLHSRSHKKASF